MHVIQHYKDFFPILFEHAIFGGNSLNIYLHKI